MMRRQDRIPLHPRDIGVLALTRIYLQSRGPLGDAQLVGMLEKNDIPGLAARHSLARLEGAQHLRFGASGWQITDGSSSIFSLPVARGV